MVTGRVKRNSIKINILTNNSFKIRGFKLVKLIIL